MKDALGVDLRLGQRVAVPSNSRFKIGILYNYRPNRNKHYLEMVTYVTNLAQGIDPPEVDDPYGVLHGWRRRYYTQENVEAQANKYYIRFQDGKTRSITERLSIIGVADDAEIDV